MDWTKVKAWLKGSVKSWTMRFNALVALAAANWDMLLANFPQLQAYLPQHGYQVCMVALLVGNMLLRMKTSKPLAER